MIFVFVIHIYKIRVLVEICLQSLGKKSNVKFCLNSLPKGDLVIQLKLYCKIITEGFYE